MSWFDTSHSRKNLLTGEWVLVSPHRTERPWQGQLEMAEESLLSKYKADCYLCPGNERAGGIRNPDYSGTFVFDNDFAALARSSSEMEQADPLLVCRDESGRCRVVCYSERHDVRLATMRPRDIAAALATMFAEFDELDRDDNISYVQMFENRGAMMGCSNMHPHAQIWATSHVPNEPAKERRTQQAYFATNQSPLLGDYLQRELDLSERVVFENSSFVALVPYWATWPYETLILPRIPVAAPTELDATAVYDLGCALRQVIDAYDHMFHTSTPYSMGFHPRPSDRGDDSSWVFHAHLCPPLLRSATVRKHMVGFEMFGMPQRDLTPELAAQWLRKNLVQQ